jgi:phosphotransferase system HPr (HPr) family protein
MREAELTIRNPSGLHARPAAAFVKAAAGFRSRITIVNLTAGKSPADAKSILGVLSSGVSQGHRVRIAAEGDDEADAIDGLSAFVEGGLGEPVT